MWKVSGVVIIAKNETWEFQFPLWLFSGSRGLRLIFWLFIIVVFLGFISCFLLAPRLLGRLDHIHLRDLSLRGGRRGCSRTGSRCQSRPLGCSSRLGRRLGFDGANNSIHVQGRRWFGWIISGIGSIWYQLVQSNRL
jgi:hypothetical protein